MESRIDVPQHAWSLFLGIQFCGPLFAETNFVQPMKTCDGGNKNSQGQKRGGRGVFSEYAADKIENVQGEFGVTALLPMDDAAARAQSGKVFFDGARSRHFCECAGDAGEGVRVATRYRGLAEF